jgi:Cupin domain
MAGRREDKGTDSRVADAQPQLMKHTPLVTQDLTGLVAKEGVLVKVEHAPGASDTKHAHPGYLFTYILEGAAVWEVDGQWAEAHHDRAQARLARHLLLWLDPGGIIPMGRSLGEQAASAARASGSSACDAR